MSEAPLAAIGWDDIASASGATSRPYDAKAPVAPITLENLSDSEATVTVRAFVFADGHYADRFIGQFILGPHERASRDVDLSEGLPVDLGKLEYSASATLRANVQLASGFARNVTSETLSFHVDEDALVLYDDETRIDAFAAGDFRGRSAIAAPQLPDDAANRPVRNVYVGVAGIMPESEAVRHRTVRDPRTDI